MTELNSAIFLILNGVVGRSAAVDLAIIFFADCLAYVLVAAFIVSLILWRKTLIEKVRVFLAALIAVAISHIVFVEMIRLFYFHPRPFSALTGVRNLLTETSSSFPSGHATLFFTLSGFVYGYNSKLGIVFFILSGIMGIARVSAGVHYPLDILGGAVFGILVCFAFYKTVDKFRSRV